jgi:hypothetical protein
MAIDRGAKKTIADILAPGSDAIEKEAISVACAASRMMAAWGTCHTDPEVISEIMHRKGEAFRKLIRFCPTSTKGFSCSAFRLSASLMSEKNETYALLSYRNMVLHNVSELSQVQGRAFARVLNEPSLRSHAGMKKLFMIGLVAFDESKKNLTKVQVNDEKESQKILRDWIYGEAKIKGEKC